MCLLAIRMAAFRTLDRPILRPVLAAGATAYALHANRSLALWVFYDRATGAWGRRTSREVILDKPTFNYWGPQLTLTNGRTPWSAMAVAYWLSRAPVRLGETVLDVGAEVGSDIHAFADAVGPTGRVVAIEAHPVTFDLLSRGVVLSNRTDRVTCVHAAVTGEPGTVLIADGDNSLSATVGDTGHPVPGRPLDDICDELGVQAIGLLKMNIEGAERDAIRGMRRTLQRTRQVIVACHDFRADLGHGEFYRTRDFVTAQLSDAGFTIAPSVEAPDHVRDHVLGVHRPT